MRGYACARMRTRGERRLRCVAIRPVPQARAAGCTRLRHGPGGSVLVRLLAQSCVGFRTEERLSSNREVPLEAVGVQWAARLGLSKRQRSPGRRMGGSPILAGTWGACGTGRRDWAADGCLRTRALDEPSEATPLRSNGATLHTEGAVGLLHLGFGLVSIIWESGGKWETR